MHLLLTLAYNRALAAQNSPFAEEANRQLNAGVDYTCFGTRVDAFFCLLLLFLSNDIMILQPIMTKSISNRINNTIINQCQSKQ